ncbi:methyl-accepting chemotaxis protein [Luteibacter sp. HA06]
MRLTVRMRIVATMVITMIATVAVGISGLLGVRSTFGSAQSIYNDNLLAVTAIVNARQPLLDTGLLLDRGLIDTTRRGFSSQVKAAAATEAASWANYYPARVSSRGEQMLSDLYIAQRKTAFALALDEATLLDEGKVEQARSMHIARTIDAVGKAANSIDALVRMNEEQAKASFDDATRHYSKTEEACTAIVAVSFLLLAVVGFLLTRAVIRPLEKARGLAMSIHGGQLNNKVPVDGTDELADTLRALSGMDDQLSSTVASIRDIAVELGGTATEIARGIDDLSQRTQEQASSLEETAASMEELSATVEQNANGANEASKMARRVLDSSTHGQSVSSEASNAMLEISGASERIGEIIVLIDEIAFQTNLLALNAAVEAARAGDQGRGFAVVASEVRALAGRSAAAAKDIKALIGDTLDKVGAGSTLVARTADALGAIARDAQSVNDVISTIAAASSEQSVGIGQVNNAVVALDEVTQQNATLVEEASAASKTASDLASELLRRVQFFRLGDNTASPPEKKTPAPAQVELGRRVASEWAEF